MKSVTGAGLERPTSGIVVGSRITILNSADAPTGRVQGLSASPLTGPCCSAISVKNYAGREASHQECKRVVVEHLVSVLVLAALNKQIAGSGRSTFEAKIVLREYESGRLNTAWTPKGRPPKELGPLLRVKNYAGRPSYRAAPRTVASTACGRSRSRHRGPARAD